jgi:hypothetical protein
MNTRADDLHEARRIVTALERCQLRNDGDRRFCATWANYLRSAGDQAQIGRYRLAMLRRVVQSYGISQADEAEQTQVVD